MELGLAVTLLIVLPLVGIALGFFLSFLVPYFKKKNATKEANKIIRDAENKAKIIKGDAKIDAKTLTNELKAAAEQEIKERKQTVVELEKKLDQREASIDRREQSLQSKEDALESKKLMYDQRLQALDKKESEVQSKLDSIINELQKVAEMSLADARDELMKRVEQKMTKEIATFMKNKEEEAEEKCEEKAKEMLSLAISKYSQDVTCERTVSTVVLPSEEMKGRIIGREGRNIKSLESLLGVDIIIDDTPEVITLSCFDPIRREIARLTLEGLIKDGRIQPGRIEDVVNKKTAELNEVIQKAGEEAVFQLGLGRIDREMINLIGRLKYRYSYGQNVLQHSIEVAHLAGMMAAELGLKQNLAKRAGLLHDIGKAIDFEQEGSHVELGVKVCKKHGESDVVLNAIASHHGDEEPKSIIANLVAAADTLSAARPGSRYESLENYVNRLEELEKIANSFDGIEKSYAIQAGREVRVMVQPEKIDDINCFRLAREIKDKIENELTYPGQIKVTVIRETRASETAK